MTAAKGAVLHTAGVTSFEDYCRYAHYEPLQAEIFGGLFIMPHDTSGKIGSIFILALLLLSGCGIIYTDIEVPRAYRSATPIDVESKPTDKIVIGESCNQSVLFLFAWGKGGYVAATKNALEKEPPGSILYDVQTDMKGEVYAFGIYTKICTVVRGKVASL